MNASSGEILAGEVTGVTKRRHRKCTDIISLLLFLSMLGATAYMTYEAMQYEDYDMECAVNRPRQWNGEMCNLDQVLRWPYRKHPDPAVRTFAVCESKCASNEQQSTSITAIVVVQSQPYVCLFVVLSQSGSIAFQSSSTMSLAQSAKAS